jgi:hypothetical protein
MSVPNNPFQNPFYNRFNDPVTRRHDETDAYAWLRSQQSEQQSHNVSASTPNVPTRSNTIPATDYTDSLNRSV